MADDITILPDPGVCWVVAYKDAETGEYVPDESVYMDMDEALSIAVALLEDAPMSDPRVVQVIIDPEHPSRRLTRAVAAIEDDIDDINQAAEEAGEIAPFDKGRLAGLKRAADLVTDEAVLLGIDDLGEGGKA